MPISPLTLNRRKPTLTEIIAHVDRGLIMSTRTTLATATSIYVDAPFGYDEYLDDIIVQYEAAGWLKVQVRRGKSRLQDKLEFFSFEYTPPAEEAPSPVVSLSGDIHTVTSGSTILFGISAQQVDPKVPIAKVELFEGANLLDVNILVESFSYTWRSDQPGTYSFFARVTDAKGQVGVSKVFDVYVMQAV